MLITDNKAYKVIIVANSDAYFAFEYRKANSLVTLSNVSLRFESLFSGENSFQCFQHSDGELNSNSKYKVVMTSIKGNINAIVKNKYSNEVLEKISIKDSKVLELIISDKLFNKNDSNKRWVICFENVDPSSRSYFSLQIYNKKLEKFVEDYKKQLYSIFINLLPNRVIKANQYV